MLVYVQESIQMKQARRASSLKSALFAITALMLLGQGIAQAQTARSSVPIDSIVALVDEDIILRSLPNAMPRKAEIIDTGIRELESRAALIRETGVSIKTKKNSLLIIAEALGDFLPLICA